MELPFLFTTNHLCNWLIIILTFRYFKDELSREQDPLRRELLLIQIRSVEENILRLLHAERIRIQRENLFMQRALEEYEKRQSDGF